MALVRKASVEQYWNSSMPSQSSAWFRKTMSRNRFQNILKFLHASDYRRDYDRQHPAYDPASRFRALLSFMNRQFLRFMTPTRELCVDETLVSSRGRQYIPSKAAKYGVKFWVLCESATGYILQMSIYRGKIYDPVPRGQQQGTQVVVDLLRASDFLHKGYHIFCDSFFTSLNLASTLLRSQTYLTGTLRKNRPMPNMIRNADPLPNQSVCLRKGDFLCMAHRDSVDKKPVRLLSTLLPARLPSGRPRVIASYNYNMGAVDTTDALMSAYGQQRKCRKVWKKVLIHLFYRILHNTFILYHKNTSGNPMSRLKFPQEVIEALGGSRPEGGTRRRARVRVVTLPHRKEKDCCVCSDRSQGIRRRSRTACVVCGRGLHQACLARHSQCTEQ